MSTEEVNLTTNKREILKQFKFSVQDLLRPEHTDAILLKWLRARNFDLRKTEQIFRENAATRQMYGVNTITETYVKPEVVEKYERTCFLGFAKDGSAVRYGALHADLNGYAHCVSGYEIIQYFCHVIEKDLKAMRDRNRQTGQSIAEITYIFDFEDFTLQHLYSKCVMEAFFDNFVLLQDHFPECWNYIFVANAPGFYDKILTFFKPVLKSTFLEKIKVASKSTTGQLLRKYVDDDVLPVFLGGTRTDSKGDPRCREFLIDYHKVPEEYYLLNSMHLIDETDPGVEVVTVRAWQLWNVPVVAREAGAKIRVEIRTENGSIYFCILHRRLSPDAENVELPKSDERLDPNDENANVRVIGTKIRIQAHISPWDSTFTAWWPGIYIFQFDNTSSWIRSRKLFYRIAVSPPDS